MFPHTVTIYNTSENRDYTVSVCITILNGVLLSASEGETQTDGKGKNNGACSLYIPMDVEAFDGVTGERKTFAAPDEFSRMADKAGMWTLDETTFFVKGEIVEEESDFRSVNERHDFCYRLLSVETNDYGNLQHWKVVGR